MVTRMGFTLKGINFESLPNQYIKKTCPDGTGLFNMVTRMGFEPMNASVKGW